MVLIERDIDQGVKKKHPDSRGYLRIVLVACPSVALRGGGSVADGIGTIRCSRRVFLNALTASSTFRKQTASVPAR